MRRDLQKMWGQAGWSMPSPSVPALLLLVVGELGMLWGEKNSMKRRKSPRNRLGMVPRVEVKPVQNGDMLQKYERWECCVL